MEAEKNGDKDGKALYKLMKNTISRKTMGNLRNRIDASLVSEKGYLKWTSKPKVMSHEIFNNNLVAVCKRKIILMLNKPAYIGMYILGLSKVLMYEYHYDYIKNK